MVRYSAGCWHSFSSAGGWNHELNDTKTMWRILYFMLFVVISHKNVIPAWKQHFTYGDNFFSGWIVPAWFWFCDSRLTIFMFCRPFSPSCFFSCCHSHVFHLATFPLFILKCTHHSLILPTCCLLPSSPLFHLSFVFSPSNIHHHAHKSLFNLFLLFQPPLNHSNSSLPCNVFIMHNFP